MQQLRGGFALSGERWGIADAKSRTKTLHLGQADHVGDERVIAPVADIVGNVAFHRRLVNRGGCDGGLAVERDLKKRRLEWQDLAAIRARAFRK